MIYTLETRITAEPDTDALLTANAAHWSGGLRTMWSLLYRQKLPEREACARVKRLGFTSKQAGSLLIAAQMRKAGLVELKKYERSQLELAITKREASIREKLKKIRALETRERKLNAIRSRYAAKDGVARSKLYVDALRELRKVCDELIFCQNWIAQKERALSAKKSTLQRVISDLTEDRYSLCFGSKKLLRQRPGVDQSKTPAFSSIEQWQQDWDCARNGQWWAVGHKDLPCGNSDIQWNPDAKTLRLRLTDKLAHERMDARGIPQSGTEQRFMPLRMQCRFIEIPNVDFTSHRGFAHTVLAAAIGTVPITMRVLYRLDAQGKRAWYVQASIEIANASPQPALRRGDVIGVDFNARGVAWCAVKSDGNRLVKKEGSQLGFLPWTLKGVPVGGRKEAIGWCATALVRLAQEQGYGIAIENLDFATKKVSMRAGAVNRPYNDMLGSLPSSQFAQAFKRSCELQGVPLFIVNPLYSSVGGFTKYGRANRMNADTSAALWLGRQAIFGKVWKTEGNQYFVKRFDERLIFSHLPVTPTQSMTALAGVQWRDVARALSKHRKAWGKDLRAWVLAKVEAASTPFTGEPDRAFAPTG